MNVFMLTSVPMTPPWDQGDKNFAYALTEAMPEVRFRILTSRGGASTPGANLSPEAVYRTARPTLSEKAWVYAWLLKRQVFGSRWMSAPASEPAGGPVMASYVAPPSPALNGYTNTSVAPDLYHLVYRPYPLSSFLFRLLPGFRRRPVIHTIPASAGMQRIDPRLFFADRLVALSEHGRQALLNAGLDNVDTIPTGVDTHAWAALTNRAEQCKARLGLAGRPVLLFPGHYGPGQGADVMLAALPGILARHPTAQILFACRLRSPLDKQREQTARQAVERMGLSHAVRFYNIVPDMRTLIGASDLVVLPLQSMHDKIDIPTTLLEALAASKPVIYSDIPPMNELEAGVALPPGDAPALAQAVADLLADPAQRCALGQQGQEVVQTRFDIHRVARQYLKLYREVTA